MLGDRAGDSLSPVQGGREGVRGLLAHGLFKSTSGKPGNLPPGQEPLGHRESRLQAHLPPPGEQRTRRLAVGLSGADHRAALPNPLPPSWDSPDSHRHRPLADPLAQLVPPRPRRHQLTGSAPPPTGQLIDNSGSPLWLSTASLNCPRKCIRLRLATPVRRKPHRSCRPPPPIHKLSEAAVDEFTGLM